MNYKVFQNKGFTLIEFLIALVVIGFIVTLLVGAFANPLKEASLSSQASAAIDAAQAAVDAVQRYEAKTGVNYIDGHDGSDLQDIATAGIVSVVPTLKKETALNANNMGFWTERSAAGAGSCVPGSGAWGGCWGDADKADDFVYAYKISCKVCKAINKKLDLPEELKLPINAAYSMQCVYDGTPTDNNCYLVAPVSAH